MPVIKYTDTISLFSAEQFTGFCVGWQTPLSPERLYKVLQQSAYVVIAYNAETRLPVGFINAISDKELSAYIPLLEVLPAYQKQGIGKKLVELMLEKLEHLYMIDLCCDEHLEKFYNSFDFTAVKGMVRRNYSALKQ